MFNAKKFKTMKRNYIKPETDYQLTLLRADLLKVSLPTATGDEEDDGWAEGGQNIKGRYGDLWDDTELEDFVIIEEE